MDLFVDVQTQGLNARAFITASLRRADRPKETIFHNPLELNQHIIDLAIREAKRGHITTIWGWNMSYDAATFCDITDKHLHFHNNRPFIWTYQLSKQECTLLNIKNSSEANKTIIKYLDLAQLFRLTLSEAGQLINLPKLPRPKILYKQKTEIQWHELKEIELYNSRNTEIQKELLKKFKEILPYRPKSIYTIHQVAINNLIREIQNKTSKEFQKKFFTFRKIRGNSKNIELITRKTYYPKEVKQAYRGGKVENFQHGKFPKLTHIDVNSLWPYSMASMPFPDLSYNKKVTEPLTTGLNMTQILRNIGVSKALVKNTGDDYGLLLIRIKQHGIDESIGINKGQQAIGVWTNYELHYAMKNGYEIQDIEWTVIWEETNNELKEIIENMYQYRTEDAFKAHVYKRLLNSCIGKFGENSKRYDVQIDHIEKVDDYKAKDYDVVKAIGMQYVYKKELESNTKRYYTPIIPCLVTAYARVYMHTQFKKIPIKDLIYSSVDSIIFQGDHLNKFKISTKLGDFKLKQQDESVIWGRNAIRIGDKIKVAGINPARITKNQFDKGILQDQKMRTVNTVTKPEELGTFQPIEIDLDKRLVTILDAKEQIDNLPLLIDLTVEDIRHFLPKIREEWH